MSEFREIMNCLDFGGLEIGWDRTCQLLGGGAYFYLIYEDLWVLDG